MIHNFQNSHGSDFQLWMNPIICRPFITWTEYDWKVSTPKHFEVPTIRPKNCPQINVTTKKIAIQFKIKQHRRRVPRAMEIPWSPSIRSRPSAFPRAPLRQSPGRTSLAPAAATWSQSQVYHEPTVLEVWISFFEIDVETSLKYSDGSDFVRCSTARLIARACDDHLKVLRHTCWKRSQKQSIYQLINMKKLRNTRNIMWTWF